MSAEEEQALVFDDRTEMEVLGQAACYDLLRGETVGRIAFWDRPEITIMPVNYVVDEDRILFRTAGGAKLSAAIGGSEAALEVDGLDPRQRTAWSVVVHGELTTIQPDETFNELRLRPWSRAPKENWVTINPRRITGRRILTVAQEHLVGPYQRVRVPSGPATHLRQAP